MPTVTVSLMLLLLFGKPDIIDFLIFVADKGI